MDLRPFFAFYPACVFIVAVWTMAASAFAAIAAFEMVFFSKNDIPFGSFIKIVRIQLRFDWIAKRCIVVLLHFAKNTKRPAEAGRFVRSCFVNLYFPV